MKCPGCQSSVFERVELEDGLSARKCRSCGGHWIDSTAYWKWREKHPGNLPENDSEQTLNAEDNLNTKVCPSCFKFLNRYSVGHGTGFTIERCEICRGVWFDKNEWEILREKNLHDDIHFVFSSHWQKSVRSEEMENNRLRMLSDRIGEGDFAKVVEFRKWVQTHKEFSTIMAFLNQGER